MAVYPDEGGIAKSHSNQIDALQNNVMLRTEDSRSLGLATATATAAHAETEGAL